MNALILSNGLDTNGQNTRYVKAAERWGSEAGVIRALAVGNTDPAGVVARFQMAADKLGGLVIREAHRAVYEYMQFPSDIVWDRRTDEMVKKLAVEADVIHLNNSFAPARRLRLHKASLIHHHGSLFRNNTKQMMADAKAYRVVQAVSTIDLTKPDPSTLHWLPTAYDVDALLEFRNEHMREPDGRIRIVHCPTNRELKATETVIAVVDELKAEGLPLDLVLVEQQTWAECMAIKATADLVIDQLAFGYGCNAVEAWGMGVPVISGGDEWTETEMVSRWGQLPYYSATIETLKASIRTLAQSEDARAEWAAHGLAHVRRFHDDRPALEILAELYGKAMKAYTSGRAIPSKLPQSVTFVSKTQRAVSMPGLDTVQFVNGKAKVDDPELVMRLRTLAKRKNYGISEDVA